MQGLHYKNLLNVALLASLSAGAVAQSPVRSDILLLALKGDAAAPEITDVVNITDNPEYSNQPYFLPDSSQLRYTQALGEGDAMQMDSMLYQITPKTTTNLTGSPTSEYSPTPMPEGSGFSVILVDEGQKQWLWEMDKSGKPKAKFSEAEPVGYHAWLNEDSLIAFILGEPHTLQRLSRSGQSEVIDEHIGASLWAIPGSNLFSYTKNPAPDSQPWTLMSYNPQTGGTAPLVTMPDKAYYMAWSADGSALTAVGATIYSWHPAAQGADDRKKKMPADNSKAATGEFKAGWQPYLKLDNACDGHITRLHMSPDGHYLAIVCETGGE